MDCAWNTSEIFHAYPLTVSEIAEMKEYASRPIYSA
jgi:hypothetical protein